MEPPSPPLSSSSPSAAWWATYSIGYMRDLPRSRRPLLASYHAFMGVLIAAMLRVVVVQNGLLFLIAWEVMSLASFFLVAHRARKGGSPPGRRLSYLVAMQIGAAFLIAAFVWASRPSGAWTSPRSARSSEAAASFRSRSPLPPIPCRVRNQGRFRSAFTPGCRWPIRPHRRASPP